MKKKFIHRSVREEWEGLAEAAMKKRWHERCLKSHAIHMAEKQRAVEMKERRNLLLAERRELNDLEMVRRKHAVEQTEQSYNALIQNDIGDNISTSPLLLDKVITPICEPSCSCTTDNVLDKTHCNALLQDARKERDRAISLARQFRDLAETSRTETRTIQSLLYQSSS